MLFRPARVSDLDEISTLLATPKRGPEYFHALFRADPGFDPGDMRIAWTGGHIVACVRIYPRLLRISTVVVAAGGIGNLRTDARYWRQGLATALLGECLSTMYREGMAIAPLFAQRQDLFVRRGWRPMPETLLTIPAATVSAQPGATSPAQARPLEGRDIDELVALHESANAGRTGSVVRDRNGWLVCLTNLNLQGATTLIAERDGALVGYVAAQPRGTDVEILELLLAPWAEDVWDALLRAACAAGGVTARLTAGLPADYRRMIRRTLGARVRLQERHDLMMRVVDPRALVEPLVPLLAARLNDAGKMGALRVLIGPPRGGVALCVDGTEVSLERPSPDDTYLLPQASLLALLFGITGAPDQLDALDLPPQAHDILSHLFPPQDWVFWRSDAF